jgi:hypothetical protein
MRTNGIYDRGHAVSGLRVNGDDNRLFKSAKVRKSAHDSVVQPGGTSRRGYVTASKAQAINERLDGIDRCIIDVLSTVHLASGRQMQTLLFGEGRSAARIARRHLENLTDQRVVTRMDRRPGGVRGGSLGFVYALDVVGQTIVGVPRRRRRPRLPGMPFVAHALAVTECYATLKQLEDQGLLELISFEAEPECWRDFVGPGGFTRVLKPDAFVITAAGEWEDRWFLEVDRATESKSRLTTKCRAFIDYYLSGREQAVTGVFPRVLWVAPDERRSDQIVDVLASLPAEYWHLFGVCTDEQFGEIIRSGAGEVSS